MGKGLKPGQLETPGLDTMFPRSSAPEATHCEYGQKVKGSVLDPGCSFLVEAMFNSIIVQVIQVQLYYFVLFSLQILVDFISIRCLHPI